MRLLLSECSTVQEVMEAANASEALAKIHNYATPRDLDEGAARLAFPRVLIQDSEIHMTTDQTGALLDVEQRQLECCFEFYIPDIPATFETVSDEYGWVLDKLSDINDEALALTGRGEPISGRTHPCIKDPVLYAVHREPDDERGDTDLDIHPDQARWFGTLIYEVH